MAKRMDGKMIEVKNLSKRYGDTFAVKDASFTINRGEILGFLGRNGAGKSTTMNIITGYISASAGQVTLDGFDILDEPREAKRHIGYLPEVPPLYPDMTVEEYLRFVCAIKDVRHARVRAHVEDVCELTRIGEVRKRLIKNLSKGYKQRVGLAQALIGNPDVIILDEPTAGLDPGQIIEIRRLIQTLGQDHTVVLSSHILHEVEDICERVIIIHAGRIIAQDTLSHLAHSVAENPQLRVRIAGPQEAVLGALRTLPGVLSVREAGQKEAHSHDFLGEASKDVDVRQPLIQAVLRLDCALLMLRPMDVELEDIFLRLTGEEEGNGGEGKNAGNMEA